jgi:hypothetical protein
MKRRPMCPTCAQTALRSLVAKRQAAASQGDRPAVAALDQQIGRMLGWRYRCDSPGLPPVVTLGEIVSLTEVTR